MMTRESSTIVHNKNVFINIDLDIWESDTAIIKYSNSNSLKQIRLKDYIKDIYISEFSTEWKRNILDLIPCGDRRKHSSFINLVLDEVKKMYIEDMKDFALRSILSCKVYKREHTICKECNISSDLKQNIIEEYTMYNRSIFLKRRCLLAKRYFLSYPIISHVVNTAHHTLPTVICDFRHYHGIGILTLHSFQDIVFGDIKKGALMITNKFYTETFKAVQRSKILKSITAKRLPQVMQCLTNVFVQQILNVMMRSINHIISIMRDARSCPQIDFQLVCENDQLVTRPDIEEVFSMYHDIIRRIETIAQDLIPLEEWLDMKASVKYIKITLPDWFVEESHHNLQEILDVLFQPVNEHVALVSKEFGDVCASSTRNRVRLLTSRQPNFDVYLTYIHKYEEYLGKTNSMLSNLYYNVGKLEQVSAKESLKQICCEVINVFTVELVMYHQDFNHCICSDFEDLKSTALDIPKDAESLIHLGEYMSHASKVTMKEQELQIRQSIYMLCKLSDITLLSDEHVELNKTTVNWLRDIQPIFAQNNTLCEAMKSELEEDLQRRINTLNSEVDAMFPQLIILDNMDDVSRVGEYVEHYKDLMKKYDRMNNEMQVINSEERLFKFPETEFPKISELKETIVPFYKLIYAIHQWQRDNSVWLNGPFECLDASIIEKKTISYLDKITEMSKTMKSRIKMDATANKSYKFAGIADDPDPMQQPAPLKLCWQALRNVNEFKIYLPLAVCMCNPALEVRHWQEMSAICNFDLTPNAGTTLKKMIDMNLMDNIDKYKAISLGANKELRLQRELAEMIREWQSISFEMSSDTQSGIVVFKHADDIETLLREHLIKIEEMRASHFVRPILSDVIDFFGVLLRIQESLDQWTSIQFRKLLLDFVFPYPGIATRLDAEATLYLEATKMLSDINNRFTENSNYQGMKESTDLLEILSQANEKLEKADKGLRNYLDQKRLCFPRFFFLENLEIREILFKSDIIKRYTIVKKCFPGIERLKLNRSGCIQCIIGCYGESIRLKNNIPMSPNMKSEEEWLIQLEREMIDAVCESILQYHPLIDKDLIAVCTDNVPSMTIICGLQLHWTSSVEECLTSLNSATLRPLLTRYADWMVSMANELRSNLTRRRRSLLMSLIIIAFVHRDILRLLIERNVTERKDFEWAAQLRYYHHDEVIKVSVFNATIEYGYEYNYYQQNIVNTPLTDRCFRAVMQAHRYHLYSSIIGPTDTGKTETIRSLTSALAKLFYVINCNQGVSYECVTQAFKGVISCGAWICLENLDRLKLELLSAIAQNLTQMKQAVSSMLKKSVNLDGCTLNLNVSGNICVNINPRRSEYTDLPANLKVLFRSVSIIAPDIERIAEIALFAGGFLHAKDLAVKLSVSYKLLSEFLERKNRYNLGLSSLKTVVETAIDMKRNLPEENEYTLLLRSMIDINIPQLCNTDILIFQDVMQDVFPESVMLPFDHSAILSALESVCTRRHLTLHQVFKLKAIQVIELMYVRCAFILVGEPLAGKTEILHTLAETFSSLRDQKSKLGATVKVETVIPDVLDSDGFFGQLCEESRTWRDGLCTAVFRRFAEDSLTDRKWLVLDGTLNGAWIENFYTALDENRMLCLASGERLPMTESMRVIFETVSLVEASPSLISRCGIIHIDAHSIGWRPYALAHIAKHNVYSGYEEILNALLDWAIDPCLKFLRENIDTPMARELHLVISTLNLLEIILKDACEDSAEDTGKDNHFIVWAQAALILAIAWGMGGNLTDDSQTRFNAFCTSFWNGANIKYPKPDSIKHFDMTFPTEGLIQDNFYIFKGIGNWRYCGDSLKAEKIPEICNFNQIFIPTISSVKYHQLFSKHIQHRQSFLVYGDVAVGKSCMIRDLLNNRLPENCLFNFFSFTSMLSVSRTQSLLLSKMNRIKHTSYGLRRNRYCVNFVDDVSEAVLQRPEAQSVLELLRQLLSYGYCYNVSELTKVSVQDIVFALAVTTGKIGVDVPFRFLRHFNTYTIPAPTVDNIFRIYSNVLLINLKKNLFAADVTGNVNGMVNATIDVYKSVIKTLRPLSNKLHYFFDMRDVSRVITGCSLIQKESVETKVTFIRLWVHEILRVFGDRISDEGDKEWLLLRIRDTVKKNFKDSFETAFDHLPKFENGQITKDSFNDFMFGNLMDTERSGRGKRYEEIGSMEMLKNKVLVYLDEYNANAKKKLDIVATHYMLKSLIKISRILSTPGGNALMISTIGSGMKSTTALAAFMQQQSLFETTTESYYDVNAWRNNLRRVLRECGALRKDVTYFMSERQIKDAFLSDISCLLSTGEIHDLFSIEDKHTIIEMTRLHAQGGDRNVELSARSVMLYFVGQCKSRLHFMLCFSPTSIAFRTCLYLHPNLVKHCTMNCYEEWPNQALLEIAVKHMKHVNVREEIKAQAAKISVRFYGNAKRMSLRYHETYGRTIHMTSSAFLHMLKLYTRLTSKKQEEIVVTRNRYVAGLEKLELAAEQVEQMKATLTILKPQLELSAQQTVITMKEVENENVTVERATTVVKEEEEIANKKAEIAGTLKSECEADLAVAIPILEDAVIALNTLKPTDITLVKAMKNPPDTIKLVMAAVCVMLGVPPDRSVDPATGKKYTDFWGPSKRILGDMNFLQNLKDYDKDNIAPAVMQVIKKTYMTDNSFMPHIVAKASSAAEGLCKWVRAMVSYDEVAKVVAPKKKKLFEAQMECDEAEAFLNEKRQTLAALNAKLAALNDSLRQTLQKKLKLETEVATCTAKLVKAEKLIASLGGEKDRWIQCTRNLQMDYDSLVGDMLLSCGLIAYMASYNISFRDEILTEWKEIMEASGIPYTKTYNFVSVLGVEIEINHWQLCGLSKNRFAIENAVILNNSEQWCLFVDSQNQINQWIKKIEQKNDLKIVKLTDADHMTVIQQNIENGVPVLLENVGETLEIALEPILLKDIYKNDDWYINIADKPVRYSQNFRFYITTRLSNPNYAADVFSKLTIIDFSMPDGTLRDKLLDIVISKERPELQEKFETLRIQDAINKKVLQQQEDNILSTLSSTTTNILEDENAIRTLDSSKTLTVNIMKRQEAARAMTKDINKFRDAYLQFADYCAELFCTLNTLSNLNHMYRFSFSWFIQLYITSIETSNRSVILEKRLQFLKFSFIRNLHSSVCRSLFEKHKLLYSFLLCVKVLIDTEQITQEEVKCFTSLEAENSDEIWGEAPDWLPATTWRQVCRLSSTLPNLHELVSDFRSNRADWERYCKATPFHSHPLPKPWADSLTRFQKLLIVKVIRRDKVVVEIMRLIEDTMGDVFNSYPHLQISESYAESSCFTPIIFILPSYSSPLSLVSTYASTRGYTSKFVFLSMSDRRQSDVEDLIRRARRDGGWVLLENCHHATRWISRLQQICEDLSQSVTSLDFRLWLSSCSTPDFPISILQNSVKIAYDYSLQLKQSLLRTYRSEPIQCKEFFEGCPGKDKEFSKLLYGLCFFHVIVKERRHFGPQGWNIPYDFDQMDLEMSIKQLQDLINDNESVPFDTLLYFIGECNYGGKIMNNLDRKYLWCLLESFCNARVVNDVEYSFSNCTELLVPQRCEYRDIIMHIKAMQLDAPPETFAVDENALITRDAAVVREFVESMSLLDQIRPPDREIAEDRIQETIDKINDKLPVLFDLDDIRNKHPLTSSEPLNAILIREAELINKIVITVTKSLNELEYALNGDIIMNECLEDLSKQICNNEVPYVLRTIDVGIVTSYLSNYIGLLLKRVDFVQNWRDNGLSSIVHFDALSCCKRFLTAALLTFSRRHNVSVEQVALDLKVTRNDHEYSKKNVDTYYIHNLHLFGARWDTQRHVLTESLTNVFYCNMPPVRLTFSRGGRIDGDVYECPLYISPARHDKTDTDEKVNETKSRYIISMPLETDVSHMHWIKRGTALFCQVNE